jgi:PIN domain nuclease of toxin-antitoxin system
MGFLLDTHTFLWFASGDKQLPTSIRNKIKDVKEPCFLSIASLWEITIKNQIGKLTFNRSLEELFLFSTRNEIEIVDITFDHLLSLSKLPRIHNDPFDRLIISQAVSENLTIITRDQIFKKYKVKQQWA